MPLLVVLLAVCLGALVAPAQAATRKGDALLAQARAEEARGTTESLGAALTLAGQALQTDPDDIEYQAVEARIRVYTVQRHVHEGDVLVERYRFPEALAEYQKAAALDPHPPLPDRMCSASRRFSSSFAGIRRQIPQSCCGTRPQREERRTQRRFATIKPPPQLEAQLPRALPKLRVNQQPSSEVFALLGRLANVRVLFDPDYQSQSLGKNQVLDFAGLTLDEAFDYVALISKSFWRPLSRDTVLIANEDPAKHNAFDDQVTKVLYLTNVPNSQEVQRIGDTVKNVTDLRKLQIHADQNALVLRGDANRVALAEKLVGDLDKAKAEIIIDVIVLSVSRDWVRDLGVVFGITQSNLAATFTPRAAIGAATSAGGPATIPLSALQHLRSGDFAITLPGAALNALLQNQSNKIVDKAQLRTVEGQKSTLRIGQKIPYATGSFAPGGIGSSIPLVNTQFSFFDVGLNIDVVAKVHGPDEVSLHIESDHSSVADYENVGGGLVQPVITQRKRVADVRVKEGEVNFWDVVTQRESIRTGSGVPGLVNIPIIGRIFNGVHREENETTLLHLLIPHIIRAPDIQDVNVAGIASGNEQVVRLSYTRDVPGVTAPVRSAPSEEVVDVRQTLPPDPRPGPLRPRQLLQGLPRALRQPLLRQRLARRRSRSSRARYSRHRHLASRWRSRWRTSWICRTPRCNWPSIPPRSTLWKRRRAASSPVTEVRRRSRPPCRGNWWRSPCSGPEPDPALPAPARC